ncbi:hypothetical protein Y032_0141g2263 [Ancylostoma ceylanicum]|uniref:Uncharacterized protein n=1 Tax=Ancylostoma ceylanicum TaxID=53326 RepID=A0A016T420_9BILA|nr:hypothetical protein Y032_0141g2263 [Ancylostoma ceylanicum]
MAVALLLPWKARGATAQLKQESPLKQQTSVLDSYLIFLLVDVKCDEQLSRKTQIRHCGDDSIVSGAVAPRASRGRGWATAIATHCTVSH